jgi:hypothetical protein
VYEIIYILNIFVYHVQYINTIVKMYNKNYFYRNIAPIVIRHS